MLILSAAIGEGHDLPARMIADGLAELEPGVEAPIVDALRESGRASVLIADDGSALMFNRLDRVFDGLYWLFARWAPSRALGKWFAHRLGSRGLTRLIAERRPDVIVSTYPGATEVVGHLRARGRLGVPVVSAITDLAALQYWAHPGVDLHLVIHPESEAEIRAIAPGARVVAVRGMTDPAFERPVDPAAARAALGLPDGRPVIVVSGGGWAVGDLGGAARAALAVAPGATLVLLCGRSDAVRETLAARFAGDARVRVLGFTDRMSDVLAAADVLVHSTAGLTVFEALLRGCRVISYGWGVAHIRLNNRAYADFGLAAVAPSRTALAIALREALAHPGTPDAGYAARPSAAAEILALVSAPAPAPAAAGAA